MLNLVRRLLARHRLMILLCALLLAGFQYLMCAIVATTDVAGALRQMLAFAPPLVQALMTQMLAAGATDSALLAFGWQHPITQALGSALAIVIAARAVAGEIEYGTLELVLAQPVSRAAYLNAYILFAAGALAVVALAGAAATALGQRAFELELLPLQRLGWLVLGFLLLQFALFALTLTFSALGREGGRAATAGVMLALLSYMIAAVAALWPRAAWIGRYSLHEHFDARAHLVQGSPNLVGLAILAGLALIGCSISLWWFHKRDLP